MFYWLIFLCLMFYQGTSARGQRRPRLPQLFHRRKQLHNPCTPGAETPYRKISREELLLFSQSPELPVSTSTTHTSSSSLRDSTPPLPPTPSSPPSTSPSPALEHHSFARKGSPDLTCVIPESQSLTFSQGNVTSPMGKGMYNGILEKSYSFGQLPVSMLANVGRKPSLTSLDSEGRSVGRDYKLQSTSSQDSSDNDQDLPLSSKSTHAIQACCSPLGIIPSALMSRAPASHCDFCLLPFILDPSVIAAP
uniref:uncharacterized protein LOC109966517 n=1 Tax=Monopterus albus TaxID=43700 RepID=UPI0009B300F4|nr:uncharacterized protein LOC109966517 [Monopterus albus]